MTLNTARKGEETAKIFLKYHFHCNAIFDFKRFHMINLEPLSFQTIYNLWKLLKDLIEKKDDKKKRQASHSTNNIQSTNKKKEKKNQNQI